MAEGRKFYRTLIIVEVLSDEPYEAGCLDTIAYDITEGDVSGNWEVASSDEVDRRKFVSLVKAQHCDPGFFGLDDEGNDLEDGL